MGNIKVVIRDEDGNIISENTSYIMDPSKSIKPLRMKKPKTNRVKVIDSDGEVIMNTIDGDMKQYKNSNKNTRKHNGKKKKKYMSSDRIKKRYGNK